MSVKTTPVQAQDVEDAFYVSTQLLKKHHWKRIIIYRSNMIVMYI